ncbi:MAG: DUF2062 domain-containing protein, partial [Bdellovibrionota bacterium]
MILRVCVCIPTFNNPKTIESVVVDVLKEIEHPILIVDDGSNEMVSEILAQSSEPSIRDSLVSRRVRVLRLTENKGKGIALQRAIDDCVSNGFTHMLAIDGDGQHYAREGRKLIEVARNAPWDLVIGARKFESETIPASSKFGRKFSNFWVGYQTGVSISDSQSGYRLYPLFHLQTMKFTTKRYDFEIEVLIRLMWKGVGVRETEIDVFYPERSERVSHFDKLWDNVRISILNTILVVFSLLKARISPRELAVSVGAGVFIGATPFFGFHTLLVAFFSFVFRLNATAAFIGSQVSIPPLAPFLIIGSILIGRKIVGPEDFDMPAVRSFEALWMFAKTHLAQWLIGSLVLGAILGLATGVMVYVLMRTKVRGPKSETWNGRSRGGKFGNEFLRLVLKNLGLTAGYFTLKFIVPYFYIFSPKGVRSLNEYWSIIRPEMPWFKRQMQILGHFEKFGQVLMDQRIQRFSHVARFKMHPHGLDNITEAVNSKTGLIVLSAHAGSWSLAAELLPKAGLGQQLTVVEYKSDGTRERDIEDKVVLAPNLSEQPIFNIHERLQSGLPIGLMGDRPLGSRYELISF